VDDNPIKSDSENVMFEVGPESTPPGAAGFPTTKAQEQFLGGATRTEDRLDTNAIDKLADQSYRKIGNEKGIDPKAVYYSRQCETVSDDLNQRLLAQGLETEVRTSGDWEIVGHNFIVIKTREGETLIDPTWQQFLESPNEDFPRVLISSAKALKETLSRFGTPESRHNLWLSKIRTS